MFAVGVRCTLFPSSREANSYFEEEMASTFGEAKSVDTHFCQWSVVSISLHCTLEGNISDRMAAKKKQCNKTHV